MSIDPSSSLRVQVEISLPSNRLSTMSSPVTNHRNNIVLPSENPEPKNQRIYFGYGSNLWLHQMRQRCPTSKYIGIARLKGYKWIIYERGYANIVQIDEEDRGSGDAKYDWEKEVWGLVYTLEAEDQRRLDRNEGVPSAYQKEDIECELWRSKDISSRAVEVYNTRELRYADHGTPDTRSKPERVKMLVYINRDVVGEGDIKEEYIYRMNMGIKDALHEGVPKEYVKYVLRKWIPEKEDGEVVNVARRQAMEFKDQR